MSPEPTIAIAVSARTWPDRLRRWLADHGGARVRVTALSPADLADEEYSVLLIDDASSFLSQGLIKDEHRRGRLVVGVHDPTDVAGGDHLRHLAVDELIPSDASPGAFVALLQRLHHEPVEPPAGGEVRMTTPATVLVSGVSGGVGTSEVALGLSIVLGDAVLVDLAHLPSLAQRASLSVHPNLATAAEAIDHGDGDVGPSLQHVAGSTSMIAGLPGGGARLRASLRRILASLEHIAYWSVLDVGCVVPDGLVDEGSLRVVVAAGSPVGITRCIDHLGSSDLSSTHLVVNRAPRGRFEADQIRAVITAELDPRSITVVPEDPRVRQAVWNGVPSVGGAFRRVITELAVDIGVAS